MHVSRKSLVKITIAGYHELLIKIFIVYRYVSIKNPDVYLIFELLGAVLNRDRVLI